MKILSINRNLKDRICFALICIFSIFTILPVILLSIKFLWEGLSYFSFEFFFQTTSEPMKAMLAAAEGENISAGIANGILGSFYMVFIGSVVAIPLGIVVGIFMSENKKSKFGIVMDYIINILHGAPPIIIGLIVYLWIVRTFHSYSALAGGIALSFVMLPLIIKRTAGIFLHIPDSLKENGYALGGSYIKVIFVLLLPSVKRELFATILKSISKGIGETAVLLFTALGASEINWHINQATASLPTLIWELFYNPYMKNFMWSGALLLLVLIFLLNTIAKHLTRTENKK